MASSQGSRTLGFIASPPAVSRPCGLPFASVVSTFPAPSGRPKPHETSALMSIPGEELHSAACGPQPKAAIRRWSGFDLESQDLHPDDRVNHSDGAAMNGFVDLHGESITGVIETFDRVIFKGHLNGFFPDGAFGRYLSRRGILLKDAGWFFEAETQRIRDHVVSLAAAAGRPVEYLAGASTHRSGSSKEARARAIAERDGVTEGL